MTRKEAAASSILKGRGKYSNSSKSGSGSFSGGSGNGSRSGSVHFASSTSSAATASLSSSSSSSLPQGDGEPGMDDLHDKGEQSQSSVDFRSLGGKETESGKDEDDDDEFELDLDDLAHRPCEGEISWGDRSSMDLLFDQSMRDLSLDGFAGGAKGEPSSSWGERSMVEFGDSSSSSNQIDTAVAS